MTPLTNHGSPLPPSSSGAPEHNDRIPEVEPKPLKEWADSTLVLAEKRALTKHLSGGESMEAHGRLSRIAHRLMAEERAAASGAPPSPELPVLTCNCASTPPTMPTYRTKHLRTCPAHSFRITVDKDRFEEAFSGLPELYVGGVAHLAPVASPLPEQTSEYCYHTPSDSCDSDCANQEFADERAESYFRSQAPVPPVALPSDDDKELRVRLGSMYLPQVKPTPGSPAASERRGS